MTRGLGPDDRPTSDNGVGNVSIARPGTVSSQPPVEDSTASWPLQVSMHVTLPGDVWLELDGKRVTVEDARRLAGVLVDVATAAETLQRHNDPQPVLGQVEPLSEASSRPASGQGDAGGPAAAGQAKTTGPVRTVGNWPDDRSRDEVPRHSGPPPGMTPGGPATQSGT